MSYLLLGGYIAFIAPNWHPSNVFGGIFIAFTIGIIAFSFGRFLSGRGRRYLVLMAATVAISVLLFTTTDLGH